METLVRSVRPLLLMAAVAASLCAQDYGGPSVLSRGGAAPGTRGGQAINFTYYGGFTGTYTSSAIPLNEGQGIRSLNFYGATADFGVTGSHLWRKSAFGVDYRGSFRYDKSDSFTNGSEQALSLFYSTRLNPRAQFVLSETATTSSFAFGNYTAAAAATSNFIGVPLTDLFDNRVYSTQTSAAAYYRVNRSFTFQAGADAFSIYRQNKNLVGVNGYRATGGTQYTYSRRTIFFVTYDFTSFRFPRAYGDSAVHAVNVGGTHRLSKSWRLNYSLGSARAESLGVQTVTLDPVIADLLGVSVGSRAIYNKVYTTNVVAGLSYSRKRSNVRFDYSQGVSPGNGVYLTSNVKSASAGYSYSGLRKMSISGNGGYYRYSSLFQQLSAYDSYQAGFTANYTMKTHIFLYSSYDMRKFTIIQGKSKIGNAVSIGVLFSPSRVPLPAW